ncbi:thioredoxin domain-containing protein [Streptococcus sp. 10F2]
MKPQLSVIKIFFALFVIIICLSLMSLGIQAVWKDYIAKDYDSHLTETVYIDTVENQNVNLVFYKEGCPYCRAGKEVVVTASKRSHFPTFYINVDTQEGQVLVDKYQVDSAATIVKIRGGKVKLFEYATEDRDGNIKANKMAIQEALIRKE